MTTTNPGSNIAPVKAALSDTLRELGRESIGSALAKPKALITLIAAAKAGDIGEDDAGPMYEQYLAGRDYAIARNSMAAGMAENAKSKAANTSKFRTAIKVAALETIDFPATVDELKDVRAELKRGGTDVKDMVQAIVDAAVVQSRQPLQPLTADDLKAIVSKKAKDEKDEITKMVDEYKRIYKLANGTEDNPGIAECMPVLESMAIAIENMGGKLPAMTAEEKKAEKAMAFLTSTGRIAIVDAAAAAE